MNLEDLQKRRARIKDNTNKTLNNMSVLAKESDRVADVAHNARKTLEELDNEFETQTGLNKIDFSFLILAIGLQLSRICIINELTKIQKAGNGNRNEDALKNFQEKLLNKFDAGTDFIDVPYAASLNHIITRDGVPYDATASLNSSMIDRYLGKGKSWNVDLSDYMVDGKLNLFKGANHRFATLGHDPILGLIFGTANIMTNTITCTHQVPLLNEFKIPILTTNHVVYTSDYIHPLISVEAGTLLMMQHAIDRTIHDTKSFVASFIKQIIHIGTDMYTPKGIFLPASNLILSNSQVESLTSYISTGDVIKAGVSASIATLINSIISVFHSLTYNPSITSNRNVHAVKTRKIIMYSNIIATGSNVLWTAINVSIGNIAALKQLDFGGLFVILKRLRSDKEFIRRIKEEFVIGGFNKLIQGDPLELEKPLWD